jgi:uncharacterized membrane protein YraQ (UPF0718 family)
MVGILVFANWNKPASVTAQIKSQSAVSAVTRYYPQLFTTIFDLRFYITGALLGVLILLLLTWFRRSELADWVNVTWGFAKQILPLLFIGVLVAGFLLGRPGHEALVPNTWVKYLVGGNSIRANLLSSVSGALMYFATLTEVPILQGLMGSGMGKGPALALLLSGPALSLPSILVLRHIMGTQKMLVYVGLVVVFSTMAGMVYGTWF